MSSAIGFGSLAVSSMIAFSPVEEIKDQPLSQIVHIQSLSEVQVSQPVKTVFLLDLDDTVFDFPHMLGSKGWRNYIRQAAKEIDDSRNWHDVLSYFLARNYPVTTIEPMTCQFVKDLQEKGYVVCGFTSRERNQWYDMPQKGIDSTTTDQLNSIGINFNNNALENTFPYLVHRKLFIDYF